MKSRHNASTTKSNRQTLIQLQSSIKYRLENLFDNIHDLKNVIELRENYFYLIQKCKIMKIK